MKSIELELDALEARRKDFRSYAKMNVDPSSGLRGAVSSVSTSTVEAVKGLFDNPETNASNIAAYMDNLSKKNGVVSRVLNYFSSHPTYNHTISPILDAKDGFTTQGGLTDYLEAAAHLEKYNIRFFAPYFVKRTLIQGVSFFYEIASNDGVAYMEFPMEMCRISGIENGVYRWMIDVSRLRQETVDMQGFPTEIKNAFNSSNKTGNKWVDETYFIVGNKGVAFCFDMSVLKNGGIAISEIASLLIESAEVDKAKNNVDIKDDIDALRFIHGKIPLDKDNNPLVPSDEVNLWRRVILAGMPSGVALAVSPLEIDNVPLSGAGSSKAYETVEDSQKQLFTSMGIPASLFGSNTTSSNIVKENIKKDAAWIYAKIIPVIESYYRYVMKSLKTESGLMWDVQILRQSSHMPDEYTKTSKDMLTFGGSRTDLLASGGMTPFTIYSKLFMEQEMLSIDDYMIVKPTSNTISGSNDPTSSGPGRPKTDNPTDDTDRINDSA